jgi:hypothetical protein
MVSVRPAWGTKALPTPARQANADGMTSRVVHYEIPIDDPDQAGAFHRDVVRLERRRVGPVDYWTMTTGAEQAADPDHGVVGSIPRHRGNLIGLFQTDSTVPVPDSRVGG